MLDRCGPLLSDGEAQSTEMDLRWIEIRSLPLDELFDFGERVAFCVRAASLFADELPLPGHGE